MKHFFTVLVCMALTAMSAHAELWLEENFNYPDGNLEQADNSQLVLHQWMCSLKPADANGTSPLVANRNLTYPGYIASGKGKVAVLDAAVGDDASTQRISVYYLDTIGKRDTISMYAAFLFKPLSAKNTSGRDFAIWEGSVGSSMCRGRVFLAKDGDAVKIGVSKNSSTISTWSGNLAIGSTNLIVMKYEVVEGASNDVVKVFVNPALDSKENENTPLVTTDNATDMLVKGFGLRQRGNGAEIGGLRIGTTWEDVVKTDGSDIPVNPETDPDIYAVEDFDYEAGSAIEGQGGWVVSTSTNDQGGASPKVGANSLTYKGYGAGDKGGALTLDSVAQEISGDLKRNTVMPFASGKLTEGDVVYTALMVNMAQMGGTSGKELITYLKQGASDGANTTMRGRVTVKIEEGQKSFAIKKNSQTIENWSAATPKEETALLVIKYINNSSSSANAADEFYLFVNPDPSKTEAENAAVMMEAVGNDADGGADLRYLCFRQMKVMATIDGIRVAKTWAKALNYTESGDGQEDGLEDIISELPSARKVLMNGSLYIIRDGQIYTISGVKIQ
ncbi:MAG: hypothetical protein J6T76_06730 [Paludibacteraceae bacterium]|nr:hypothetical protein [Paludibacteraceae bacterium]